MAARRVSCLSRRWAWMDAAAAQGRESGRCSGGRGVLSCTVPVYGEWEEEREELLIAVGSYYLCERSLGTWSSQDF